MPTIISVVSTAVMLGGFLLAIGGWRGSVDQKIAELDRRLGKAEANQERYIPVLVGMKENITYLADRARRDDERRERELIRRGE